MIEVVEKLLEHPKCMVNAAWHTDFLGATVGLVVTEGLTTRHFHVTQMLIEENWVLPNMLCEDDI